MSDEPEDDPDVSNQTADVEEQAEADEETETEREAAVPEPEEEPTTDTITDGYFEEEFHVDAAAAGDFLVELGEQLRDGDAVTVSGEGWEIPFPFAGPVGLEIEFEGNGERELEIEVELEGRRADDEVPDVA